MVKELCTVTCTPYVVFFFGISISWLISVKWNILVTKTRSESANPFDVDILITDFGLSIYHEDNSGDNGSLRGGRPSFRAPELHNKRITGTTRPTQESDSFAWAASAYNVKILMLTESTTMLTLLPSHSFLLRKYRTPINTPCSMGNPWLEMLSSKANCPVRLLEWRSEKFSTAFSCPMSYGRSWLTVGSTLMIELRWKKSSLD